MDNRGSNRERPVGILGGGLAGAALQHFLSAPSEILEKEDRPGGLCRSWKVKGTVCDRGPHIIFSRDGETLQEMVGILGDNVERHFRRNFILYRDSFVKYPFENDLYALEPGDRYRCLKEFLFNPEAGREAGNLEDWALKMFGPALARAYFLPYNEKIWKYPARELGTEWVERIPQPGRDEMIRSAVGVPTEGYTHQLYFYHPRRGGIEALVEELLGDSPRIRTGAEVTGVEKVKGGWQVKAGGREYSYRRIVCCLPVTELLGFLRPPPPAPVLEAAGRLKVNGLILVLLSYPGAEKPRRLAVYIPDPEVLPHRVSWVNYLGGELVPEGRQALMAEITIPDGPNTPVPDLEGIGQETARQLRRLQLVPENAPLQVDTLWEPYAYVVNTEGYAADRRTVLDYCREIGIPLLGRWAEFAYLNMDAVWKRAREQAAELDRT